MASLTKSPKIQWGSSRPKFFSTRVSQWCSLWNYGAIFSQVCREKWVRKTIPESESCLPCRRCCIVECISAYTYFPVSVVADAWRLLWQGSRHCSSDIGRIIVWASCCSDRNDSGRRDCVGQDWDRSCLQRKSDRILFFVLSAFIDWCTSFSCLRTYHRRSR